MNNNYVCPNCGNQNINQSNFCTKCGFNIKQYFNQNNNNNELIKNKSTNKWLVIFIFMIIFVLYCLINFKFINDKSLELNYFFIIVIFILFLRMSLNICSDKYIGSNRSYFKLLSVLRFLNFLKSPNLAYTQYNNTLKEGSSYIFESKTLYILIRTGFILFLTLIWHLLLFENSSLFSNGLAMPILIFSSLIFIFVVPEVMAMGYISVKINKILKSKGESNKFQLEDKIVIFGLIILFISDFLIIKSMDIDSSDLMSLNLILIVIILLLYKPIKQSRIKKKEKEEKGE